MKIRLNVEVYVDVPDSLHSDLVSTIKKVNHQVIESLQEIGYDNPAATKLQELLIVDCSSTIS